MTSEDRDFIQNRLLNFIDESDFLNPNEKISIAQKILKLDNATIIKLSGIFQEYNRQAKEELLRTIDVILSEYNPMN